MPYNQLSIALTASLAGKLSRAMWYAPDTSVLTVKGAHLPSVSLNTINGEAFLDPGLYFSNSGGFNPNYGEGPRVFIGGSGNNELYTEATGPYYFYGGAGRDLFAVDYTGQIGGKGQISATLIDVSSDDIVSIYIADPVTTASYAAIVRSFDGAFNGAKIRFYLTVSSQNYGNFTGTGLDEVIDVTKSGSVVNGAGGNDVITDKSAKGAHIMGGDGNDTLISDDEGSATRRTKMTGGAGADTFIIHKGDTVVDATSEDTIIVKDNMVVSAAVAHGAKVIYQFSEAGANKTLRGGAYDDQLAASGANATLIGGAGNDTLSATGANSTLVGGAGADNFIINRLDTVIQDLSKDDRIEIKVETLSDLAAFRAKAAGIWSGAGQISYTIDLVNLPDSQALNLDGSQGNDFIRDTQNDDVIRGLGGDDHIGMFGGGNDIFYGGDGNDILDSGEGNDRLYGDAGDDKLLGGEGNDQLWGGTGNDQLFGGEGNDLLYGDAGNDMLDGGAGDDSLWGGDGNDTLIGGDGNDGLYGGAGNDILLGGAGADKLDGGDGNDILNAGDGINNTMTGGRGNDSFVLSPGAAPLVVTITDFETGKDKLDLTAFSWIDGFNKTQFTAGLSYDAANKVLTIDANGDHVTDATIYFTGSSQFNMSKDIAYQSVIG
ncbi:MAG: calcium-binding protein [Chakrabartia sp.]